MYQPFHFIKNYLSDMKIWKYRYVLCLLSLKKTYDSVSIYNVLMNIHYLGIRVLCWNFIEYLFSKTKHLKKNFIGSKSYLLFFHSYIGSFC